MSTSNNQEIERKYFINSIPKDIKFINTMEISQSYLYRDCFTTIRVRKIVASNTTQYIYTVKTNGNIQKTDELIANKHEIESNISKEVYDNLVTKKISNTINKTRIVIPIQDGLKVEVDVYHDYLKDFLTAEIEFPNEEASLNFVKPQWIGEEIGYKDFSNGKLSVMSRDILLTKVPASVLENNVNIINNLFNS